MKERNKRQENFYKAEALKNTVISNNKNSVSASALPLPMEHGLNILISKNDTLTFDYTQPYNSNTQGTSSHSLLPYKDPNHQNQALPEGLATSYLRAQKYSHRSRSTNRLQ
jgi:hypothetical protein